MSVSPTRCSVLIVTPIIFGIVLGGSPTRAVLQRAPVLMLKRGFKSAVFQTPKRFYNAVNKQRPVRPTARKPDEPPKSMSTRSRWSWTEAVGLTHLPGVGVIVWCSNTCQMLVLVRCYHRGQQWCYYNCLISQLGSLETAYYG